MLSGFRAHPGFTAIVDDEDAVGAMGDDQQLGFGVLTERGVIAGADPLECGVSLILIGFEDHSAEELGPHAGIDPHEFVATADRFAQACGNYAACLSFGLV